MNNLIPFRFEQFQTQEAVYITGPIEWVKRYRFTRKAIGQFLHPRSKRPQKIIDNILNRKPHLRALSIPLTVRGKTGQEFETETYDIFGLYQIVVESDLPRKKEFLVRFPDWLIALQSGKIKPILPPTEKMLLAMDAFKEVEETPHGHKVDTILKLTSQIGISQSSYYRWLIRLRQTGRLGYKYYEGQRIRTERDRIPGWMVIKGLIEQGKKAKEVALILGISINKVYRVMKQYYKKLGRSDETAASIR